MRNTAPTTGNEQPPVQTIHIAIAFDRNYITPSTVLLTSIFKNNASNQIHLHVIATGIDEKEKQAVLDFVYRQKSRISFYDLSSQKLKGLFIDKETHLSTAAYYRLFFTELVPAHVTKLLYLDTDIVVLKDLRHLYNTDTGRHALAAVPEFGTTVIRYDLKTIEHGSYFNSGVLLINVEEWKKQRITERCIQFVHDNPEKIMWADRDALNGVLIGEYHKLDPKNNVLHYDVPKGLSNREYREFIRDKVIIHFTEGRHKPWLKNSKTKLRFLYVDYLRRSPKWKERIRLDFLFYSVMVRRSMRRLVKF